MKKRGLKAKGYIVMAIVLALLSGCANGKVKNVSEGEAGADGNQPTRIKIFYTGAPPISEDADKPWYEALEKACNVKLDMEIPPQSNANERLQIVMASGNYPDVIRFNGTNDQPFVNGVKNGVIIPITQYLTNAQNLKKYTYDISWDTMKVKNNDIYGIPITTVMRNDGYAVRKDWLDNVGLSIPEDGKVTVDEYTEMLKRFTKNDPDKNGKNDTYGMARYASNDGNIGPAFLYPFDVLGWQKYDNESYKYMDLMYSKKHDNFKKALEYSAMIHKEGYVDKNAPVLKREQAEQRFAQGVCGSMYYFAGYIPKTEALIKKNTPNAELSYIIGVKNSEGVVKASGTSTGTYGMWCITTSAKNPQKVVDFFDKIVSDELWNVNVYGVEGVHYKKEADKMIATDLFNKNQHKGIMRRKDNIDLWSNPLTMDDAWLSKTSAWLKGGIETAIFSQDRGFRPQVANEPKLIDAKKKLDTTITRIILGDLPVSAYEEALNSWYQAGGEEYIKQMNDYIAQFDHQ